MRGFPPLQDVSVDVAFVQQLVRPVGASFVTNWDDAVKMERADHKSLNCWRSVHRRNDCEFVDARGAT
jgi:hypothetical protein